jgi:hypothetical protein
MSKKRILATTIAAVLTTGMFAAGIGPAFAANHTANTGKKASDETIREDKELIKVSDDAMLSMRDVSDARLALFNGQPEKARTEIDAALTRIKAAVADAETYAIDVKAPDKDDWYIPFDTRVTMLDTFAPDENIAGKQPAKARTHMHKDAQKQAREMFKLSEVDVAVSAGLVPIRFAEQQIMDAADLINRGDYYEASMALKAVDDAVIIHTVALDEPAGDDAATNTVG